MIFELTYPEVDNFKAICKTRWQIREEERWKEKRDAYTVKVFHPKVSEFLISKEYFFGTARVFVSNQQSDDGA